MVDYTLKELIQGCIDGNEEIQTKLHRKYYRRLYRVIYRYFYKVQDTEDVLINTFTTILTKIQQYNGDEREGKFYKWMKRIAVTESLIRKRYDKTHNKESIREFRVSIDEPPNESTDGYYVDISLNELSDTCETLDSKVNYNYILSLINELPPQQKTMFTMHVIDGYKHKEIGEILGVSEETSKTNFMRARLKLQEKLQNYE